VDAALRALAHPVRRTALRAACDGERASSVIAGALRLSRPATSQHLKVLRAAGLVHVRVDGNCQLYRVDFDLMAEVREQLEALWGDRLGRLAAQIDVQRRR
jgi:DNA-binding transcriptional ArsR family regulator